MFIGHYAVGFAAKRVAPQTSLGLLILAPTFLDVLWPLFLLLGWERVRIEPGKNPFTHFDFISYPFSHSLLATLIWSTVFTGVYFLATRYSRGSVVIWIGVLSHWVLDLVTHRPDLPLYPQGPEVGLGLWNHPFWTLVIESVMFLLGVVVYSRSTRAKDRTGKISFWIYVGTLVLFYLVSVISPPPSDVRALAIGGILFGWLLVLWPWWFDRHRAIN